MLMKIYFSFDIRVKANFHKYYHCLYENDLFTLFTYLCICFAMWSLYLELYINTSGHVMVKLSHCWIFRLLPVGFFPSIASNVAINIIV